MRNKIVLAAICLALAWGLAEVVVSPLQTGTIYPEYSSLRSDPMGAMALYESLGKVVAVERLFKSREERDPRAGTTMFVLGVDPVSWSKLDAATLKQYETLVSKGARLVIAFLPVESFWPSKDDRPVESRWDVHFTYLTKPAMLELRGGPRWKTLDANWCVLERPLGAGSVVLVGNSYPLSNEGLREARDAPLIAKIAGPAREVVFDENHFGVVETGSVAKLIRKYRLEGALAVLAIVAALFLWRSASSLLPSRAPRQDRAVTGRDSLEGMTALARRGIAEKDLLRVCYEEWRKTSSGKTLDVDALFARKDVVQAYKSLVRGTATVRERTDVQKRENFHSNVEKR